MSYNDRLSPLEDKGLCGDPERIDPPRTLRSQAQQLAQLIRDSKHTVAFTGAGVSTAVGIPDFRGPKGIWTLQQQQRERPITAASAPSPPSTTAVTAAAPSANLFNSAPPSVTHLSLVALHHASLLHHTITQNVDNLHIRSGLPRSHLTELHGNIFVTHCRACHTHFYHSDDVGGMDRQPVAGRSCEWCAGPVADNAIDWTTPLPRREFERAESECRRAELVIVFGSSLRIQPASALPGMCRWKKSAGKAGKRGGGKGGGGKGGKLVIINLQATHMDDKCELRVWGKCDDVMRMVCQELGVEVGEWRAGTPMLPYTFPEELEEEDEDEEREADKERAKDNDWKPGSKTSNGSSRKRNTPPPSEEPRRRSERKRKK